MPYSGEYANKSSHVDIVRNPEVAEFIGNCDYMTEPSEEEGQQLGQMFIDAMEESHLPDHIVSVDGSYYESSVKECLPSTKIGYIKVGSLLLDRKQYKNLRVMDRRFVDPFRVAEMQDNNSSITFVMPSSNIVLRGKGNVRDSFRYAMDRHLLDSRTCKDDYKTSLRSTLFHLASIRTGELGTEQQDKLKLHKCPYCSHMEIELFDVEDQQFCPKCNAEVYPADCLRVWEEVTDYTTNATGLSRFMNILEHLVPIHYIKTIMESNRESYLSILCNSAFMIDGPLAVFGTAAWLHGSIMRFLNAVTEDMNKHGYSLLIMGLQKTGQVVDHFRLINRYVGLNKLLIISDSYRYKFIAPSNTPSSNGFGYETYYGQDMMYKSSTGRSFVFSLPYPFCSKSGGFDFSAEKIKPDRYKALGRALSLISEFECDLYHDAVIPVALAHKYTAISLEPGSKVLDLLSRKLMDK